MSPSNTEINTMPKVFTYEREREGEGGDCALMEINSIKVKAGCIDYGVDSNIVKQITVSVKFS